MAYNPEHYLENKEKYSARSLAWRLANPERAKANRKRNYENNKERDKAYSTKFNRLRRTGVNDEQYLAKLAEQNYKCAICNNECTRALAADHNHDTGVFRGLLCNSCNRGLGYFKDKYQLLANAMQYLRKYD